MIPRRWVVLGCLAMTLAAVVWAGSLVVAFARATSYRSGWGTEAGDTYFYPCTGVDDWLEIRADNQWLRAACCNSWFELSPVVADEHLEVAIVGVDVSANITAWEPSILTGRDLIDPVIDDEAFEKLARDDLERAFGAGWDTPGQTNFAWRARVPGEVTGRDTRVPSIVGPWRFGRWRTIRAEGLIGKGVVWRGPPVRMKHGLIAVRFDAITGAGRARLLELGLVQSGVAMGVLAVMVAAAWALAPPIWWRRERRRRAREGRCLACGYPQPTPPR